MRTLETAILAKLKQARLAKNLSGSEVAQRLGKSGNSFISRLECGETQLTINMLNQLCAIYEINPISLFSTHEKVITNRKLGKGFLENLEYRSETKTLSQQSKDEIKKILPTLRKLGKLMRRLNETPLSLYDFYPQAAEQLALQTKPIAIAKGKEAALKFREHLKLGLAPIDDIQYLIWRMAKIPICGLKLGEGHWGIRSQDAFGNPLIIYSTSHSIRQRNVFTIAHELGHHLFSPDQSFLDVDNNRMDIQEKLADAFAQELLVPSKALNRYMEDEGLTSIELQLKHVVDLCQHFRVSYKMMLTTLQNNKRITKQQYAGLCPNNYFQEITKLGYTPEKYIAKDIRLKSLLENLVARGLRKKKISPLFAAETLDLTEDEVRAIM